MDVRERFNTVETDQIQHAPTFGQKSSQKFASLSPDDNRNRVKKANNSSIKHILAKIKAQ
jgi:hypothetical protein